jgi:ectoine hydroxylase-related dioxygenase (phytanoyl-CoA dioxygenase family)
MSEWAVLTEEQRRFFDEHGYLIVEDALSADLVDELREAALRVQRRYRPDGVRPGEVFEWRNVLVEDPAFWQLLDYPKTVPLVWQILGWNIQLITSHLVISYPPQEKTNLGWHQDGGRTVAELPQPLPRLFIKIAYWLSDTRHPESGAMEIVPGSHRLLGRPAMQNGKPVGAMGLHVKAGTAVLFENRLWHARGINRSDQPRIALFFGYGYRWLRPMDYVTMPAELLERCNPLQRQLLGADQTPQGKVLSYYIPNDNDVPLRSILAPR